MSILDYFKRKGIDKRNYDLVVTSDKPYQTGVTDKDGIICHKTFTPPLNMVAGEEYHLQVRSVLTNGIFTALSYICRMLLL